MGLIRKPNRKFRIRPHGKYSRRIAFIKILLCSAFLVLYLNPLFGQTSYSLASEISRLEKLSRDGTSSGDRYNAFYSLVKLYQLSGSPEAALKCCDTALVSYPDDGRFLAEQGRLLISQGEYEKAMVAANALINANKEFSLQGRLLEGQIMAFQSGISQNLAVLADDPDFDEYRSGIYYNLWKVTALPSWKTRLISEFPRSMEAKIAASPEQGSSPSMAAPILSPTPLWFLFPGRKDLVLSAPEVQSQVSSTVLQPSVLQTGLFGREDNANIMGERLQKAGFTSQIRKRTVNGNDYWAVSVDSGADMNTTISKLKDLGFEAFPVY